jgi:L-lactate dehydrogenase complex protein LldG
MSAARDEILARIRRAAGGSVAATVERDYRLSAPVDVELLVDRLVDYRAAVLRCRSDEIPAVVESALVNAGVRRVIVPEGLPRRLRPSGLPVEVDAGTGAASALDHEDLAAITTCAVAIAETGTLVLDGSAGQGRRLLTLVPDHHVCIVALDRVVATVPEAFARLDPRRPLTWISGPSATSDIELRRVEGVHGPRHLIVVLVEDRKEADD